jgi:diacylglycerol kinase family enzyme
LQLLRRVIKEANSAWLAPRIHVVINPGSAMPKPIPYTLNAVFRPGDIEQEISLTPKSGDAERFSRQAAENGAEIVAAYGGD